MHSNYFLNKFIFILILSFFLLSNGSVGTASEAGSEAAETANRYYSINLDQPTIARGYTVSAFDDQLKLSLVPGVLAEQTVVEIIQLNEPLAMPWQLERISQIYQFEFTNKQAYDNHKPFYIQFSYEQPSDHYKQVYFYDKNYSSWRPLPTQDFPDQLFVRSLIHLPFARIAVFSNPDVLTVGRASWYGYKGGNYAASPDFPKGSRLRVYSLADSRQGINKFVDVEVNDYGPDRKLHPDRVLDLDKVAFAKLAPLGQGMVDIYVEPLYIAASGGKVMGVAPTGVSSEPVVKVKAALVMAADNNEIILAKNATTTLPLASLTKLVAVKVFLDTKPSLDRIISYSQKDEEQNIISCDCAKWELALLRLNDGDTLTVEDLIYSSLVGSANNTIETLVRISGLSRTDFMARMNQLASGLGANNTSFIEPTGLSPDNVSSAYDYAIITKAVLDHPIIAKATSLAEYNFTTVNSGEPHRIKNTNQLIHSNSFDITGSKTGYLEEAGYCLMTKVRTDSGREIIVVTFGADSRGQSFSQTEELLRYGIKIAGQ